jgi:hypothetical protein
MTFETFPQHLIDGLPTQAHPSARLQANRELCHITARIDIPCQPETLYRVWANVAQWHTWDPATRQASLDGDFAVGTKGRLAPPKGMAVSMHITHAKPNEAFTAMCPVLGSQMQFPHRMRATPNGLVCTHDVSFTGWLRKPLYAMVAKDVVATLPLTLTRLRALCERLEQV